MSMGTHEPMFRQWDDMEHEQLIIAIDTLIDRHASDLSKPFLEAVHTASDDLRAVKLVEKAKEFMSRYQEDKKSEQGSVSLYAWDSCAGEGP